MWIVSASCLSVVVVGCIWAALQELRCRGSYNLAQMLGITLVFFGCFPRLQGILHTQSMVATQAVAEASVLVHVGLAAAAIGHGWKLLQHRGQQRSAPRRFTDMLFNHRRAS